MSGLDCRGELVYDDTVKTRRPLLLVAPNWLGVNKGVVERAKTLAGDRYVAFVADMYGEGHGPKGTGSPMEFLAPLIGDAGETPHFGSVRHDDEGNGERGLGDVKCRVALGYCFGGSNVIDLARAGAEAQAVVSVHGVLATPMPAKRGDIKAAVLVLHGAADPVSPKAHRDMFEAEMDAAGARWYQLIFGGVAHSYTDVGANNPPVAVYDEPATRHGQTLTHAFIEDAFAGRL